MTRHHDTGTVDDGTPAAREGERTPTPEVAAREEYGGMNLAAGFFGWLVAVALAVLLTSVAGAAAAAIGASTNVTQSEAQRQAGTIGITAGVVLLLVLLVGYFAGGYVAGRMSRFDGGRQGVAVWLVGLVATVVAVGLGAAFGATYNLLDRVSLPRVPVSTDQLSQGGIITALVVLVGTFLAATAGGKVGHRYHDRVDRTAGR